MILANNHEPFKSISYKGLTLIRLINQKSYSRENCLGFYMQQAKHGRHSLCLLGAHSCEHVLTLQILYTCPFCYTAPPSGAYTTQRSTSRQPALAFSWRLHFVSLSYCVARLRKLAEFFDDSGWQWARGGKRYAITIAVFHKDINRIDLSGTTNSHAPIVSPTALSPFKSGTQ